jgi:hypothetical protein
VKAVLLYLQETQGAAPDEPDDNSAAKASRKAA